LLDVGAGPCSAGGAAREERAGAARKFVRALQPSTSSTIKIPDLIVDSRALVPAAAAALVIVDMQNDFVDPAGSLCIADAAATIPAIVRLRDLARARGMLVVYTKGWHAEDDPEFAISGRHAVAGSSARSSAATRFP
jgi:hypothetical protein